MLTKCFRSYYSVDQIWIEAARLNRSVDCLTAARHRCCRASSRHLLHAYKPEQFELVISPDIVE